jgi:hypothetical protein
MNLRSSRVCLHGQRAASEGNPLNELIEAFAFCLLPTGSSFEPEITGAVTMTAETAKV